ncbi:hypothetical protein L7F22_048122 [Adiantum nelumboides]|nr:hypothetical protein [Adiantum nelumboides]
MLPATISSNAVWLHHCLSLLQRRPLRWHPGPSQRCWNAGLPFKSVLLQSTACRSSLPPTSHRSPSTIPSTPVSPPSLHKEQLGAAQFILPIAINRCLTHPVRTALYKLGELVRWISCKEINPETIVRARDNAIETVCLLEEHFPTRILNIQVHLLVHLVDEVEIAGTVHARWMFFLERFMKTLKGFVRQRARPEGSMAEGWLVQESCVFVSEYLSRSQNNALELWSTKDDDRVVIDVPQGNGVVKRFSEEVQTKYRKYNALWSHGSHFRVEKIDKIRKTYDCGVMATFDQDASNTSNIEVRLDYYGLIQDILEVNYRRFSHFILDVRWFKVIKRGRNATVPRDQSGLYAIDSKAIWRDKNDTFVFPHQCEQIVFYPTRSNPRWWYVIQTAPCSRHIFDEGGVEEDLPEHAMEEEDEANNFTSEHLHTAMSDVETSMSREETSSNDSLDESGDHESDGNNDDPFNSIDEDDTATLNSVTSYLGLAAYTRTDILASYFGHSIIYAGMPVFSVGNAVDLIDGGEVVAKGRVVNVDPSSTLHGQPMPHGHVSLTVVRVLNGTVHIPYVPPHEPNLDTLADVVGYIIAWPSVALAHVDTVPTHSRSSRRSHSRSSRRSHSSSSSRDSTGSKYSSMSEEEFEAEARRRGFERKQKRKSSGATSCFDSCFGRGSKREEPPYGLETMYEESDSNFEFRPRTQLQVDEPCIAGTSYTPDTTESPSPIARQLVIETPPFTPIETPIETTLYYEIDSEGAPISNAKGKRVISRMHELMWIYFPDDILTDWRRQPRDSKQAVIDQLHREFPNSEGHRFKEKAMLSFMNHVLKSRHGMARAALSDGSLKPPGLSADDWRRVREERRTYPN